MSIERTMYEEAQNEYIEAGKMQLGSEEHSKTVQAANSIYDRQLKKEEIENEKRKLELEEQKLELEERRLASENKNSLIKNIVTGAIFAISTGVTIWANIDSKKFEGVGIHTTEAGKSSQRKLLGLMDKFKF